MTEPRKWEGVSYILFQYSEDDATNTVGFNRYNTPGYIDDGMGWDDEERVAFQEAICWLDLEEVGTFTYQIMGDEAETVNKLIALGMKEQEPAWA